MTRGRLPGITPIEQHVFWRYQVRRLMAVCGVIDPENIDHAIAGALWGGFANAGQTCSGIERVYVVREVADRFIAGVVSGAQGLRVGDPISVA